MRKNLTKKLFLSVLTLAFAVISLGASTYAWFTLSGDAEVKTFEGQVTGGAGLEIQVLGSDKDIDDAKWQTSVIESTLIEGVIGSVTLDAVSIGKDGNVKNGFKDQKGAEVEGGWIQFDLAFRLSDQTDTRDFKLYFDGYTLTTKDAASVQAWRVNREYEGKTGTYALNATKTYWVSDAARLAIASKTDKTTYTAADPLYFEAPEASGSGEYTQDIPAAASNAAVNYYNAVNPTAQLNYAEYAANYTAANSVGEKATGELIGTLTEDGVVRITVFVWVEGWDAECINAIFTQTLQSTLSFYLDIDNATA